MCVLFHVYLMSFTLFLIILFPVIHPDKCPHERAPEAFDVLKKASRLCVSNISMLTICRHLHTG